MKTYKRIVGSTVSIALLGILASACNWDEASLLGRNPANPVQAPVVDQGYQGYSCNATKLAVMKNITAGPLPDTCESPEDSLVSVAFNEGQQVLRLSVNRVGGEFPRVDSLTFVPETSLWSSDWNSMSRNQIEFFCTDPSGEDMASIGLIECRLPSNLHLSFNTHGSGTLLMLHTVYISRKNCVNSLRFEKKVITTTCDSSVPSDLDTVGYATFPSLWLN